MTLRTLTFNPADYKLVPLIRTPQMLHRMTYHGMLAAVPNTLPGVVEHSGEPVAWANWKVGTKSYVPYRTVDEARKSVDQSWIAATQEGPYEVVSLFTHPAPAQPVERQECTAAANDVLAERRRQISTEGWTPEHDDEHADYSLARAAAVYAVAAAADKAERAVLDSFGNGGITSEIKWLWPSSWDIKWFKPKSRRADLVKAGALILAEIERLDRAKDRGQA